jgi:hypothetical protein
LRKKRREDESLCEHHYDDLHRVDLIHLLGHQLEGNT